MRDIENEGRKMLPITRALILVTVILPSGSAFATRTDTGERVYINPRATRASGIDVGGTYQADLIENSFAYDNPLEVVPYVTVFIDRKPGRTELIEQLIRRVEEGETTARDARILRAIFVDLRVIPLA